ncbi:MAG: hypothetical protein ACO31I_03545 [Prochlorotrichaceae cyanobacterium]|jgi:hypothetical protein
MIVYSYSEAEQQLSVLLETALRQGQVKLRNQHGQIFIISPEKPQKSSAFDIESLQASISKSDILEAIQESRERFAFLHDEPESLAIEVDDAGIDSNLDDR